MMGLDELFGQTIKVEPFPWMLRKKFVRVTDATLTALVDACIASGLYSFDLETTGLNKSVYKGQTVDKIVGACISHDGETGYYIPLRHKGYDKNVSWTLFVSEIQRLLESEAVAVFHNASFDQEFLQFNGTAVLGEWDQPKKWHDTLILAYLSNTAAKIKGLKYLSSTRLGMEMLELSDIFPKNAKGKVEDYDFASLNPEDDATLWYAGSDAICTYLLYHSLSKEVLDPDDKKYNQSLIYTIEKGTVTATRWMERNRIRVDRDRTKEVICLAQKEYVDAINGVYDELHLALGRDVRPGWVQILMGSEGTLNVDEIDPSLPDQISTARTLAKKRMMDDSVPTVTKRVKTLNGLGEEDVVFPGVYDIMSSQQLGNLFRELEIPDLPLTETGKVQTSADVIDGLVESHSHLSYMKLVQTFRSVQKALSTYLLPLYEDSIAEDYRGETIYCVRAGFNQFGTDTGRFSASTSRDPKKDGGTRFTFHGAPRPGNTSPACLGLIRSCIVPKPGKKIVSVDYSGVELRIVTAMSGEKMWENEFFRCSTCSNEFLRPEKGVTARWVPAFCPSCGSDRIGDIHTLTAVNIFGEDAMRGPQAKEKRSLSKGINFGLCYGGSKKAVQAVIGGTEERAAEIKVQFDQTYKTLQSWWEDQKKFVKQNAYVVSAFGRRCHIPDIRLPRIDPNTGRNNGAFIAGAERNAINAPIQSTSADLTKSAMALAYKECKKRGWLDRVQLLMTIHDELVFEIDDDILEEAIDMLVELMSWNPFIQGLKWAIPLTNDVEIGNDWSTPWNLNAMRMGAKPWAPEIENLFQRKWIEYPAPPTHPPGTMLRLGKDKLDPIVKSTVSETEDPVETPALASYEVTIPQFSYDLLDKMAKLIAHCKGRGTSRLRVLDIAGNDLTESMEKYTGKVFVSAEECRYMSRELGIQP